MAAENCLWGAPRIHGELLKLGIAISERTVSRYLHGRPTTRSQTWRTFFANHFGDQTFISPLMFADAHDDNIVVDTCDLSFHRPGVDWGRSLQPSSLGARLGHNHFPDRTAAHQSRGRDPPQHLPLQPASRRSRRLSVVRADSVLAIDAVGEHLQVRAWARGDSESQLVCNRVVNVVGG